MSSTNADVSSPLVERDLSSGALLQVLRGQAGAITALSVVYAERLYRQPKVRAFVDHMVARCPET
ncbi:MAG TPA: hypothetical protein QGF58_30645 [Myxococcota bacterium]|nr:hypothetical protein [Myxococcota bacterium]